MESTLDEHSALHIIFLFFMYVAATNGIDGRINPEKMSVIAQACLWPGDPKEFLRCLKVCGFVDNDGKSIHHWHQNQPLAEKIIDDRERKSNKNNDNNFPQLEDGKFTPCPLTPDVDKCITPTEASDV